MADQSIKTRAELKSFFVPNAVPTADDFAAFIESGLNQLDDGLRMDGGNLSIAGALEAKTGLTVTGAPVTIGTESSNQSLTVYGALTAVDHLTAQNGLTVSSGTASLSVPTTVSGSLTVRGQVDANANLAVVGTFTATGGAVTIGDSAAATLPMTVHHSLTVNNEVTLNKGLTVKGAGVSIGDSATPQALNGYGKADFWNGLTVRGSLVVATGNLGVNNGYLKVGSTFYADTTGVTVKGTGLTIGEETSKQPLTVNGAITASDLVTANNGIKVDGAQLVANAGLLVKGAAVTIGEATAKQDLTVYGTVYGNKYLLAPPTGDISPVIAARTIPANQGAANEATEMILFHGDDYIGSGYGPDYITLRAPGIRLQTYASVQGTPSIDNPATSNTRFDIDSNGVINAYSKSFTVNSMLYATDLMNANGGLSVKGNVKVTNGGLSIAQTTRTGEHNASVYGAYITGDFEDAMGVVFRHTNGTQGIGFGSNTIYAAGSIANQPLRLKARGTSSVEVIGNLSVSGSLSGPPNDYLRAQFNMSGGGTVTWADGRLKWTTKFLAVSVGVSASIPAGHVLVEMPTADIPASNVYDGVARSVDAKGILLKPFEALYAVHTMGGHQSATSLRIVIYHVVHTLPSNWLLVAVNNNDDKSVKLGTGEIIYDGGSRRVTGTLTVGGLLTANNGLTVSGAPMQVNTALAANAGLIVYNAGVTIGTTSANQSLVVNGTAQVNKLVFAPPPGDPSPVIATRTIPTNQGGSNEATELILFHGNDNGTAGYGPDLITLRAPGLRFQTYADGAVNDIGNASGSINRMYIEPTGPVNIYQGLVRLGTGNAASGQVMAVIGCMGQGVSHGQIAYRAGYGFELIDCTAPGGPILNYNRDGLPYTDLRLKQLQYQNLAQFSSRTLKEDIRDLSSDEAQSVFQQLNPVTYRLKSDATGRKTVGFIAEDVPDLVSADDHQAIAPIDILAVLTRIVHMQQESIERLQQQIAALTTV